MNTVRRFRVGAVLGAVLCIPLWLALSQQTSKTSDSAIDLDAYYLMKEAEVADLYDLADYFTQQQLDFRPLLPPAADFILRQPGMPDVIPFDPAKFPEAFLKGLVEESEFASPVYFVELIEDPITRATVFVNRDGQELYRLPAPHGYDPFDFLKSMYPRLYSGAYSSDIVKEYEALYDPSRIHIRVKLLPSDYVEPYLYTRAQVEAYQLEQAEWMGDGDGVMMMLMGGSDSNIVMSSIAKTTGGQIRVSISYPEDFTNRLDIFYATDLLDRDWRLAAEELSTDGTNVVSWVTTNAQNHTRGFFAAGNADLDSDEDGYADARERFLYKTDPDDPDSHPVILTGEVSYDGPESGLIHVLAVTDEDSWSKTWSVTLPGPGVYTNLVANQDTYWFKAFMDVNGNQSRDVWEPQGAYSSGSLYLTTDVSGLDITLEDQPSIWGTVDYTGPATGNIHVIAVTSPDSWDTTYQAMITWIQGEASLTGGTTYASFPLDYSITGLPPGEYWIRTFIDEDYSGEFTLLEPGGQYAMDAIPVTNRVTGIDFTIDLDTDEDGIPDWWEMQYFGGATNSNLAVDSDNDGLTNWEEYLLGTDPLNPDTDGDWFMDGYEIELGKNPLNSSNAPLFMMFINDNAQYTTSTNLLITMPGVYSENVFIGEQSDLSDGVLKSFADPLVYSLQHTTNGLRQIFVRLHRGANESPIYQGSIVFDDMPPILEDISPTNNFVTDRRWVKIAGSVHDEVSEVRVFVNAEWSHGGSDESFWHDGHILEEGTNVVVIRAEDLAGNATTQTVHIIRDTSGDTTPPSLEVFLPGQNVDTNGQCSARYGESPELYFSGTIDDETAQVFVYAISTDGVTNGPWEAVVVRTQVWARADLEPGTNLLIAMAMDAAGNTSTAACYIVRDTNVLFSITSPTAYQVMNVASTFVSGVASHMFLNGTITVNGVTANIFDQGTHVTFTTASKIPLNPGRTELIGEAHLDGMVYYTDPPPVRSRIVQAEDHWYETYDKFSVIHYYDVQCSWYRTHYDLDKRYTWDVYGMSQRLTATYNTSTYVNCSGLSEPCAAWNGTCLPVPSDSILEYFAESPGFGISMGDYQDWIIAATDVPQVFLYRDHLRRRSSGSMLRFEYPSPLPATKYVVIQFSNMTVNDVAGSIAYSNVTFRGQPGFLLDGMVSFLMGFFLNFRGIISWIIYDGGHERHPIVSTDSRAGHALAREQRNPEGGGTEHRSGGGLR